MSVLYQYCRQMSGPLTSSVCVCLVVWNKTLDASLSPNHITITPTYPNKQSITFYRDHYLKQLSKWENCSTQTDSVCQSPKNHFYNILKEPKINQNLKVLHCKCWTCTIEQKYSTSGEETFDFRQKKATINILMLRLTHIIYRLWMFSKYWTILGS